MRLENGAFMDCHKHFFSVWQRNFLIGIAFALLMSPAPAISKPVVSNPPAMRIVFGLAEPLYATGTPSIEDSQALDRAITNFQRPPKPDADLLETTRPLTEFVHDNPTSLWRSAVQTNLGIAYYRAGYFTRAIEAFQDAWAHGKDADLPGTKEMVDRAVGELAAMYSRLGRGDELKSLLAEIGMRPISGSATELITGAHEAEWMFKHDPGNSYLCGPMALKNLLETLHASQSTIQRLDEARSGPDGFSFAQVSELANSLGLKHQVIRRREGDPIPVPSIVNWKLHHFAAIVEQVGDRFHLKDPTFGTGDAWLSADAINEESSGYFLIPATDRLTQWQLATRQEQAEVHGKGFTTSNDSSRTLVEDVTIHEVCGGIGMCVANAKEMLVSLFLSDIPVGYDPPVGPSVKVQLVYNQREAIRSTGSTFFSVGQKWTMNFESWIEDNPQQGGTQQVTRFPPGGGSVAYDHIYSSNADYSEYPVDARGGRFLRYPSAGPARSYEFISNNGEHFVYEYSDGATSGIRRLLLSKIIDTHGKALHLEYATEHSSDGSKALLRLKAIIDAIGNRTTFDYSSDALTINKITDPFGRSATLVYQGDYLKSITDVIGITSSFNYQFFETSGGIEQPPCFLTVCANGGIEFGGGGSSTTGGPVLGRDRPTQTPRPYGLVTSMTTPYGTTFFDFGQIASENFRYLTITDPQGFKEHIQFRQEVPGIDSESDSELPKKLGSLDAANKLLKYRNSFYWDKYATAFSRTYPGSINYPYTLARLTHWLHKADKITSGVIESQKDGFYDNPNDYPKKPHPSRVWFFYPGQKDTTTVGNSEHPSTIARVLSDGSTQITTAQYNAQGQVTQTTDPLGRVTRFDRDTNGIDLVSIQRQPATDKPFVELRGFSYYPDRRLKHFSITGKNAFDYEYYGNGNLHYRTDKAGKKEIFSYNDLSQLTRVEIENTQLWQSFLYDKVGRLWTKTHSDGYALTYDYDDLDRIKTITYPDKSTKTFIYDRLDLHRIISRTGVEKVFSYDLNRRLTSYSDGLTSSQFNYYENGALKDFSSTGGKNLTRWNIDLQGRPTAKIYADGTQENYTYDPSLSLLTELTNPAGERTTYTYYHDGRLESVKQTHGDAPADVTRLGYDDPYYRQLTSVFKTKQDGSDQYPQKIRFEYYPPDVNGAPQVGAFQLRQEYINDEPSGPAYTYDSLGHLATATLNKPITYHYDSLGRIDTYQGLQDFNLNYYPKSGRLQNFISNLITTEYGFYDNANDQHLKFIKNKSGQHYDYGYDAAGNINNVKEADGTGKLSAEWQYEYDAIDRLTLGGKKDKQLSFGYDASGNLTTLRGQDAYYNSQNQIVSVLGPRGSSDKQRRYVYDASNRLIEINYPSNPSKYTIITYDALGRISTINDHDIGPSRPGPDGQDSRPLIDTTTALTWCGLSVCRDMTTIGGSVPGHPSRTYTRWFLSEGYEDSSGKKIFYLRDHLGSVRETVSATGVSLAKFDYDAYGKSMLGPPPVKGFAGMYFHGSSGLYFTRNRVFDPEIARWLTRDPIAEQGGLNLYAYVNGNPLRYVDRSGNMGVPTMFPIPLPTPPSAPLPLNSLVGSAVSGSGFTIAEAVLPVTFAFAVGYGLGTGINYFIGDKIQDALTPLLDEPMEPVMMGKKYEFPNYHLRNRSPTSEEEVCILRAKNFFYKTRDCKASKLDYCECMGLYDWDECQAALRDLSWGIGPSD